MFIKSLPHHSEILTLHILRLFFPALLLLCVCFGERLCLEMCDGSNFFCSNTQNSKLLQQQIILLLVFQPRFNAKCVYLYIYISTIAGATRSLIDCYSRCSDLITWHLWIDYLCAVSQFRWPRARPASHQAAGLSERRYPSGHSCGGLWRHIVLHLQRLPAPDWCLPLRTAHPPGTF